MTPVYLFNTYKAAESMQKNQVESTHRKDKLIQKLYGCANGKLDKDPCKEH